MIFLPHPLWLQKKSQSKMEVREQDCKELACSQAERESVLRSSLWKVFTIDG